ncbi:hypothetical protein TGMAS_306334 [Toxoplasma gondii MAS]|uniref:Uncharacterized protein n=2 Tax=Toxoplasma gondii TaxID=5811 RepID=A0A086QA22_TOXGO|nr:hypothetical protein TGMAS_306334 [Toxoplasma gondii MAS]PUA86074.1 hypothetical protein TGBR9_306334 [Toxoplasma gondii TgCATBr9]
MAKQLTRAASAFGLVTISITACFICDRMWSGQNGSPAVLLSSAAQEAGAGWSEGISRDAGHKTSNFTSPLSTHLSAWNAARGVGHLLPPFDGLSLLFPPTAPKLFVDESGRKKFNLFELRGNSLQIPLKEWIDSFFELADASLPGRLFIATTNLLNNATAVALNMTSAYGTVMDTQKALLRTSETVQPV